MRQSAKRHAVMPNVPPPTLLDAPATRGQLDGLTRAVAGLTFRLEQLEKKDLPAATAITEALSGAICDVFGSSPFTAAWILEATLEPDEPAVRLSRAVTGAVGAGPTVQALSRFLSRSIGTMGPWRLTIRRTRDGRTFMLNRIS